MSKHDDGGPAYACADEGHDQTGMSLWDYYAGQSLAGYRSISGAQGAESSVVAGLAAFDATAMIVEKRKREAKNED